MTDDEVKAAAKARADQIRAAGWELTAGLLAELGRIVTTGAPAGTGAPASHHHPTPDPTKARRRGTG